MSLKKGVNIICLSFMLYISTVQHLYACFGDPNANFSVDNTTPVLGETVTFTDASEDANYWVWNFGIGANPASAEGENGVGPHEVVYTSFGLKTVSLRVYYSDYNYDTETKNNYIDVGLPPTPGSIGDNQNICSGDTPALLTSATDGGGSVNTTIKYEWEKNETGIWVTIEDASGATYEPLALTSTTRYRRRTVTDWGDTLRYSAYTTPVTITVNPLPTLSSVAQHEPVCDGSPATINLSGLLPASTFSVDYSINGVPQTQETGLTADGSGNASFTTSVLSENNNGQTLQITNITITSSTPNCSQNFSEGTILEVFGTTVTSGTLGGASEFTYCEGRNPSTFSVGVPTGGDGNYTYQWEQSVDCLGIWTDAVAQDNGPINTLSFNPPALYETICYRLRITDGCGSEGYSATKTYFIVPDPAAPVINPTPAAGSSVCTGENVSATFESGSGGTGTVTDVYEYSTDGGSNWNSYIPGENITATGGMVGAAMIQIRAQRTASETGCDNSEWNYVSWSVDEIPNNSSDGFSGNTICAGENGILTFDALNASFETPYTIEYSDGTTTWSQVIPDASPFNFNVAVNPVETTNYSLVSITNGNGCARTADFGDETARIVVYELPTATISDDATICEGESATITADLTGTPDWNLTFQLDGTNYLTVENIPSSPYTFTVTQAGEYTVSTVSDAHCVGTASGSASIAVNEFNMVVSDVTSVASGNHCPEFGGPFDANTASYNPGVTEVVFKVEKDLSVSTEWTFDFEVDETGDVEVYDLTLAGNNSALSYSGDDAKGSINATDNTEVIFTFQIENVPGTSLDVEFTVSNGNDGVCGETGSTDDNRITHVINEMPAVGSFTP